MRIVLNYLKLKEDFNRIEVLHWGHFSFVVLAITLEFVYGASFFGWAFTTGLLFLFYRLFFITKKELFYSFWSFSALLILFLVNKIFFVSYEIFEIKFLYIVGLILLGVEIYILSSPIYYPRVSWWEYDFRYRTDLKVFIEINNSEPTEARVTDLRRGAGCVASFEEFKVGDEISLNSPSYFEGNLEVEIVSKRIYSLGRPYNYGVRFLIEKEDKKKSYGELLNVWRNETLQRREKKFTTKSEAK